MEIDNFARLCHISALRTLGALPFRVKIGRRFALSLLYYVLPKNPTGKQTEFFVVCRGIFAFFVFFEKSRAFLACAEMPQTVRKTVRTAAIIGKSWRTDWEFFRLFAQNA
ncbi:MAG: hypothetical protein IKU55_01930 [Clostridia bacterium]|nr:hypothetical protein [Clostridia bacterium]